MDKRIQTATDRQGIDYDHVEERLKKYDQKRERYYNTNTNKKWGSIDSYDMCLDSGKLGYNMCRDIIVKTVEMSE